ncbi:hypothetical protein Pla163_10110 [Planctomycetes bacterium Pla163]|uniref:LPXTG cell wall anchor domain-containing protein n=1 Tax=Rohdeia mirabilis TaxID=2528008 RepID=A0A518CXG2_9BACT|nr:hypothetical protein Pla163_10110 [Planctomycetes bacterium Pla163]
MKFTSTAAILVLSAALATPAHASNGWGGWSGWGGWNSPWGGWSGGWGNHDDDDNGGWGGGWGNHHDDLDGDYCDDDDNGGWGGWDDDCEVTPPAPSGVPEIDANLLGTGLLLLVGGGLVLTSRGRLS